jgi:ribosome-associated protein
MDANPAPAPAPAADESLAFARRVAALVAEKRGTDIALLDVRPLVDYTDFFLVATGQSGRQNQTIAEHVVRTLKAERRLAVSKAGLETGSWICLDLGDVVVHVFEPEVRARYDLELLWADADRPDPLPAPEPAAPRRRRSVRRAAVEDADAANAPDSERPADDVPAEEGAVPSPGPGKASPKRVRKPSPKRKGSGPRS